MTAFIIPTLANSYQFNKKNAMTTFINVNFYQDLYQYNDDLYQIFTLLEGKDSKTSYSAVPL